MQLVLLILDQDKTDKAGNISKSTPYVTNVTNELSNKNCTETTKSQ